MERWLAKLIGLILTFLLPFIFTVLPHHMKEWIERHGDRGKRILCLLMCFGGGIFLATYLLHMGPEVRRILEEALLAPNNITYPLPDFIIGCGFFGVLLTEKLVMRFNKRRTQKLQKRRQEKCSMYQMNGPAGGFVRRNYDVGEPCDDSVDTARSRDVNEMESVTESNCVSNDNAGYRADDQNNVIFTISDDGADKDRIPDTTASVPVQSSQSVMSEAASNSNINKSDRSGILPSGDDELEAHHTMRSLILIMALSLHHLFEGISLGLQSTVIGTFMLLIALLCHETIISFSLGLQFIKCSYSRRKHYITAFACSIVEPIGVAVGMVMSEVGRSSTAMEIVDGVLQAFATGTFIFVTFFEILQEEIDPRDTSISKVLSALAGFIVMSLLMLIPEDSEPHPTSEGYITAVDVFHNYTTVPLQT